MSRIGGFVYAIKEEVMYNRNKVRLFHGVQGWILGVVLAFTSMVAVADPQQAAAELQRFRVAFTTTEFNFQIGKTFASAGNANVARSYFTHAQINASTLAVYAARLEQQNRDSLQRGLYDDRAALERAIVCNTSLRGQAVVLQVQFAVLVQQPLSQAQILTTDVQMAVTKARLQQCIQEQLAAGS